MTSDWRNLYGESWSNVITSESFCHPAKFSRGLIRHIYQHLFDCGYLKRGDTVLDPFGGVALGAWPALRMGLHWVGVELEQKFVDLGQQNIDLWNERFGPHLPNWGGAVLLQGDSRRLVEVVGKVGGLVSSPPYAGSTVKDAQRGMCGKRHINWDDMTEEQQAKVGYSTNPANLGNMPAGDPGDGHGVDGVIGSPPYAGSDVSSDGQRGIDMGNNSRTAAKRQRQRMVSPDGYGSHPGQLAAMPPGPGPGQVADGLDGVIASPPWEHPHTEFERPCTEDFEKGWQKLHGKRKKGGPFWYRGKKYEDDTNLGNSQGDTFWSAARLILQQCYQVLKPGAVAVWVVKRFVRDKAIVEFSQQWADLCRSCGFELLHWHKAWLVEDGGTQYDLFGNSHERKVKRFSFFRRLHAQKYPHLAIEWEDVLCFCKPT